MEGNVVTAAKWLGAAMVLASGILVGGLRWALTAVERDRAPAPGQPVGQAEQAATPALGDDLKELANVFHGSEREEVGRAIGRQRPLRHPGRRSLLEKQGEGGLRGADEEAGNALRSVEKTPESPPLPPRGDPPPGPEK